MNYVFTAKAKTSKHNPAINYTLTHPALQYQGELLTAPEDQGIHIHLIFFFLFSPVGLPGRFFTFSLFTSCTF